MTENNARLGKECKLKPNSENFKVVYGTTNRLTSNVIYIKLTTWVTYLNNYSYNESIYMLNDTIKHRIKCGLNDSGIFTNLFIYTPETKKTLIKRINKPSHASFEFTIKQNEPSEKNINLLHDEIKFIVDNVIEGMERNPDFEFRIKK